MTRLPRVSRRAIALCVAFSVLPGLPASAQESPSPGTGAFCVLSPEEVADLAGSERPFTVRSGDDWCRYEDGYYTSLELRWWRNDDDLDLARGLHAKDGQDVELAGYAGWFGRSAGDEGANLTIDTGRDVVDIRFVPGTDITPTFDLVRPIADVAIPRLVAMLDARRGPLTDAEVAQDELVAMFPAELGGEALDVTGQAGAELLDQGLSDEMRRTLEELLSKQGRTIDDLTVALANPDGGGVIAAFRIRGAAAADFAEDIVSFLLGGRVEVDVSPATVADRDVLAVTAPGGGMTAYVYPVGDTVWFLGLEEALAADALASLP